MGFVDRLQRRSIQNKRLLFLFWCQTAHVSAASIAGCVLVVDSADFRHNFTGQFRKRSELTRLAFGYRSNAIEELDHVALSNIAACEGRHVHFDSVDAEFRCTRPWNVRKSKQPIGPVSRPRWLAQRHDATQG